jgi:sialic acid synthase SpsE
MRTKIIAEIGYNHNGSMENARKIIREVAKLGLWAVKFQKWNIEGFPENIKNQRRNTPDRDYGETYYEHRKYLEFSISQLAKLKEYAEKKGWALNILKYLPKDTMTMKYLNFYFLIGRDCILKLWHRLEC